MKPLLCLLLLAPGAIAQFPEARVLPIEESAPSSLQVRMTASDGEGQPLVGVDVQFFLSRMTLHTRHVGTLGPTDEHGQVEGRIETTTRYPRSEWIVAVIPGHGSTSFGDERANGVLDFELQSTTSHAVRGVALDAHGRPMPGQKIWVQSREFPLRPRSFATTALDGSFIVPADQGPRRVVVEGKGFGEYEFELVGGEIHEMTEPLQATGARTIRGRVTYPSGAPVRDCLVWADTGDPEAWRGRWRLPREGQDGLHYQDCWTDEEGRFELPGMTASELYLGSEGVGSRLLDAGDQYLHLIASSKRVFFEVPDGLINGLVPDFRRRILQYPFVDDGAGGTVPSVAGAWEVVVPGEQWIDEPTVFFGLCDLRDLEGSEAGTIGYFGSLQVPTRNEGRVVVYSSGDVEYDSEVDYGRVRVLAKRPFDVVDTLGNSIGVTLEPNEWAELIAGPYMLRGRDGSWHPIEVEPGEDLSYDPYEQPLGQLELQLKADSRAFELDLVTADHGKKRSNQIEDWSDEFGATVALIGPRGGPAMDVTFDRARRVSGYAMPVLPGRAYICEQKLLPGEHVIHVTRPGSKPVMYEFEVKSGEKKIVALHLEDA